MRGSTAIAAMLASLAILAGAGPAAADAACPNAGFTFAELTPSPATRQVSGGPRGTVDVRREQLTTTKDIAEIRDQTDAYDTLILLKLTPEAATRLHDATTNHGGRMIAFVIDDRAFGAVTWEGPYGMDANLGLQLSTGRPVPELGPLVKAIQDCIAAKPAP